MTSVNPSDGNRDADAGEYRGAHRRADDYDDNDYFVDHEEYEQDEAEGAGSTAAAAGGIPKRGLAMILIAVAAILLLWGIYALTRNDNAGTDAAGSQTGNTAATQQQQAQQPNQQQPSQQPGQQPNQQGQPNQQPAPVDTPAGANQNPAPAQAQGPALTKQNAQVFIYNNSPNAGLAGATADKLAPQFTVKNRSADSTDMNLPEQRYGIFPRTTVFYDPAMAGAEQVAADVARQVNGVATPVTDMPQGATLPDEVRGKREAISVVLTG